MVATLFNFSHWLQLGLIFVCTCAYIHRKIGPYRMGDPKIQSVFFKFGWKAARIGERLSGSVAVCCVIMAVHTIIF